MTVPHHLRRAGAGLPAIAAFAVFAVFGLGSGLVACGSDDDGDPPATTSADGLDDDFDETTIVGLPVDEAQRVVEGEGREFRVAVLDGEDQILTTDLVEGRVNVVVTDGLVESISFYG